MNVYFISGVGADRGVFRNIRLPEGFSMLHLDWIKPEKNETLEHYAERLADTIDKDRPFALVGLSFGGMLANEIDKRHHAEIVVLISSIPSAQQLPLYYKIAGKLGLQHLVPISFLKSMSLMKRLFTAETSEEKKYLRKAIREADPAFIRWSLNAIVHWKTNTPPSNYVHIHGSGDLILPLRYTGCTNKIRRAGHLMILTHGDEISRIIATCLPMSSHIVVRKATAPADLEKVYAIRRKVFVEEQHCPPELEYANEEESTHFLAFYDGEPCGTARWRRTDNGFKLERFAVLPQYRCKQVGQHLVNKVLHDLPAKASPVYLNAQLTAKDFYTRFGFQPVGDEFEEAGIMHQQMRLSSSSQN